MCLLLVELGNTEKRCVSQETKLAQEWMQAIESLQPYVQWMLCSCSHLKIKHLVWDTIAEMMYFGHYPE